MKRHPRLCKFLMYFGTCKFKDACSFLHKPSHQEDLLIQEVEKLKVEIEQLRNGLIQTILNKLKTLENKVDDKEEVENTETNSNIEASENSKEVFPCKSCDFKGKSKTGLKNHSRLKHKLSLEEIAAKDESVEDSTDIEKSLDPVNEIISSKLESYCPECDILFRFEELLLYRNHCRVEHEWFCCENRVKLEGCDYTTGTKDDLMKHLESCDYKLNNCNLNEIVYPDIIKV